MFTVLTNITVIMMNFIIGSIKTKPTPQLINPHPQPKNGGKTPTKTIFFIIIKCVNE